MIEDDVLVQQAMTGVLREHGFNVRWTSNGLEALRLAGENSDQVIKLLPPVSFLRKHFTPDELVSMVRRTTES